MEKMKTIKKIFILSLLVGTSACSVLSPNLVGKFNFKGKVVGEDDLPVSNAWIKIRGWETLTDKNGEWQLSQLIACGSLKDEMNNKQVRDSLLVDAVGFERLEEPYFITRASWFESCAEETNLIFNSKLKKLQNTRKPFKLVPQKENTENSEKLMPLPTGENIL
jgi:hypothetical protein